MSYASKVKLADTVEDVVIPATSKSARDWSKQQLAIFRWFEDGEGNLVVRARAGTGKTTTIMEGVGRAPETTKLLCAFNKRIAEELSARISDSNTEAKTLHSVGFMLVKEYWSGVRVARVADDRAKALSQAACGRNTPDSIIRLVSKLHTKAREMKPFATDGSDLLGLAEQFECEPDAFWAFQTPSYDVYYVCDRAYDAMQLAAEDKPKEGIDFADMIYLPLKKNWAMGKYDLVVVDEAQDMTVAQLELARKVQSNFGRMCIVGDDRQAIYGFRGADSGSIDRLKRELDAQELGLTVTYRCGQAIVERAKSIVGDFKAHTSNADGFIGTTDTDKLIDQAVPGDFILSRLNAPLAGVCMQLIREGKRAEIAGRDIAQGLKSLVRKLARGAQSVGDFQDAVMNWREKEVKRLTALKFENRVALVEDQAETLMVLSADAKQVVDIERTIERIFTDEGPNAQRVLCSSVHKAKGLEASRVFLLDWTFRDGRDIEEDNIRYVAVTRAKDELYYVEQTK